MVYFLLGYAGVELGWFPLKFGLTTYGTTSALGIYGVDVGEEG